MQGSSNFISTQRLGPASCRATEPHLLAELQGRLQADHLTERYSFLTPAAVAADA